MFSHAKGIWRGVPEIHSFSQEIQSLEMIPVLQNFANKARGKTKEIVKKDLLGG